MEEEDHSNINPWITLSTPPPYSHLEELLFITSKKLPSWPLYSLMRRAPTLPQTKEYCPPNNVHRNRMLVVEFFRDVVAPRKPAELEKYVLTDLIQHHPFIPDGIEGLRTAMSPGGRFGAPEKITFLHVSPVEDLVWVHTRRDKYDGEVFSSVSIARMECGKIAELWNIKQE
jgi:predicted SnoaL-like aldol condensation-catalyzing enzyme